MKKISIFGKQIPLILILGLLVAGLGSAALLTYYGRIVTTVNVHQTVKLDGKDWNVDVSDVITEAAPGGEKFCFEHYLSNDASVPINVNFEQQCYGVDSQQNYLNCDGITTKYYNSFGTEGPFNSIAQPGVGGNFAHGQINKTDLSESIEWTFTITDQSAHYGVGLVIDSNNNGIPDFQIYFAEFGDKQWHYQPYGATCWSGIDTTTLPAGVIVTGTETGNFFSVEIPKTLLGGIGSDFGWASQVRTTLLGVYPGWTPWCGPFVWETESTVGSQITLPIMLPSGEQHKDFYVCYDFDIAIYPGTYTITTDVVPQ